MMEISFEIPTDQLLFTDQIDLKSESTRVGPMKVYLRLKAGRGADSTVDVQLCAEQPFDFDHLFFGDLVITIDMENELEREHIGGVQQYGNAVLEVSDKTEMEELDDSSGDKGAGGSLSGRVYTSREAYDGDGEVTTDGYGSVAERAGQAAG